MKVRITRLVLACAALLGLGCADGAKQPTDPSDQSASLAASLGNGPDQQVAKGLALALASASSRAGLLEAMRASPFTEHKLVLQDFALTPTGQALVSAAAAAINLAPAALMQVIHDLPPLDFYIPSREHRRGWRATDDIVVVVALGRDRSALTGFTPTGRVVQQSGRAVGPGPVVVLLHPAEPKGRRINAQSGAPGDVIQDVNDGEVSAQLVTYSANGDSTITDLTNVGARLQRTELTGATTDVIGIMARIEAERRTGRDVLRLSSNICTCEDCPEAPGCGDPGPPPAPSDTTFLSSFITREVCDNGDCYEGNEFEYRSLYKNAAGSIITTATLRLTGVPSSGLTFTSGGYIMIFQKAKGDGNWIDLEIIEDDAWPNPEDNFDPNPQFRVFADQNHNYNAGNLRSNCAPDHQGYCTELDMLFRWN